MLLTVLAWIALIGSARAYEFAADDDALSARLRLDHATLLARHAFAEEVTALYRIARAQGQALSEAADALVAAALDEGDSDAAMQFAEEAVALRRAQSDAPPGARQGDARLASSLLMQSVAEVNVGEVEKAVATAKEAVALFRTLREGGADSDAGMDDLALALGLLARATFEAGDYDAALAAREERRTLLRTLLKHNASDPALARGVADAAERIASVQLVRGEPEAALQELLPVLEYRRVNADADPVAMAGTRCSLGEIMLYAANRPELASSCAAEASERLRRYLEAHPDDSEAVALLQRTTHLETRAADAAP